MPLTKKQKEDILQDVSEKISKQKSLIFANFSKVLSANFDLHKRHKD